MRVSALAEDLDRGGVRSFARRVSRVPIDSPLRTGPLLRAATLSDVCMELIGRVFPRADLSRRVAVNFAESHRVAPSPNDLDVVTWWVVEQVAMYGATVRLRPKVWPVLTQSVRSRIETARRRRAACLFGLPPLTFSTFTAPWSVPGLARDTRMALRILAAAGPMYIDDVLEAVEQTRKPRKQRGSEFERLVASLVASGATALSADDRWFTAGRSMQTTPRSSRRRAEPAAVGTPPGRFRRSSRPLALPRPDADSARRRCRW